MGDGKPPYLRVVTTAPATSGVAPPALVEPGLLERLELQLKEFRQAEDENRMMWLKVWLGRRHAGIPLTPEELACLKALDGVFMMVELVRKRLRGATPPDSSRP